MGQSKFKARHVKTQVGRKYDHRDAWLKLYDRDWEHYRKQFLEINHRCYACGKPSQVVDHVTPHQGDIILFEQLDNHIPLCTIDHNTVTAKFDRNHRKGQSIDPKLKWLKLQRNINNLNFKVFVLPKYR